MCPSWYAAKYRDKKNPTNAIAMIGPRWNQSDGLYDQPGGVSGPGVIITSCCARLGIIGISTAKAITRVPTSVSFAYAPASRVQNTNGAKSSQMPAKQSPQRARSKRG